MSLSMFRMHSSRPLSFHCGRLTNYNSLRIRLIFFLRMGTSSLTVKPHFFNINAEIVMNELISHARDVLPRHFGIPGMQTLREALACLADNLNLAYDCVLDQGAFLERDWTNLLGVRLDLGDRVADVL